MQYEKRLAFSTVDEVATKFALINFDVLILPIVAFDDLLICVFSLFFQVLECKVLNTTYIYVYMKYCLRHNI